MRKTNITFAIPVYNEEKRIPLVMRNLASYGRVIFLDGGSTDTTNILAHELGADIYLRPENSVPYVETTENFDLLKSKLDTDWISWGYADNLIPKKTLEKMIQITEQSKLKIVYAPLYTYLWGYTKYPTQKSYIPILVHKDYIDFSKPRIHSMGDFTGSDQEKLFLPNSPKYAVQHFSVYNSNKFITGHLRYAETEAIEKHNRGIHFSLLKMITSMFYYTWIYGKLLFKNPTLFCIITLHYASFRLMAFTKLYELENNINISSIQSKYYKKQLEFLETFE